MGVYIANMEKPKFCKDGENICFAWDDKKYKCRVTEWKKPCPLIEIDLVRCGECKHMRKYALRSDEPTGIWCHRWSVPRLVTDDDFCSYGEGRADDNKRRSV